MRPTKKIETVYSGRVTNWPLVGATTALAVVLVAFSGLSHPAWIGLIVVVVVIALTDLMLTSVRTTAGPGGIVVRYGVLGLPRFRYPAASVAHAEAVTVPRSSMGGWGIHWSPWRGTRLTIRSGPSLQLDLVSGKRVVISAENPETAARVINGYAGADLTR